MVAQIDGRTARQTEDRQIVEHGYESNVTPCGGNIIIEQQSFGIVKRFITHVSCNVTAASL